ncbi:MAG TPA: TlpA disulfide reductase family protein [Bacteroidales bacterium]|nr:TlpA disulfide reductase family protein [Bacteroidales bacterium]
MKTAIRILFSVILAVYVTSVFSPANGQEIRMIGVPELDRILRNGDDRLFVVNFWATWCAPCVKELPVFEKASATYKTSNVSFILISLDFPSQIEKQLKPFLKKNKISLDVALMTDLDYNSWIEKVDPSWQGDIPATLFFNNKKKVRHFHAGEVSEADLNRFITRFL